MRIKVGIVSVLMTLCLATSAFADSNDPVEQSNQVQELEAVAEQTQEDTEQTEPKGDASVVTPSATVHEAEEEEEEPSKPWRVGVSLGHNIGTGTFVTGPSSAYFDDVSQSWGFNGSYGFKVLGHKLSAKAGWGLATHLTVPNNASGKRTFFRDLSFKLSDGSIYKDELTGINLSGGLSLTLPTSKESIHAEKWSVIGTSLAFSRDFGSFNLSYNFGFTKYFYGNRTKVAMSSHVRDAELAVQQADAAICSLGQDANDDDVNRCHRGGPNADFSIRNGLSMGYNITEHLGFNYSVGISNRRNYNLHPEEDGYQPGNADNDRGGSDSFSTSIDVSYDIAGQFGDAWTLPFSLNASAGVSTGHGVFDKAQSSIRWPLFYNSMGKDYGRKSGIPEADGGWVDNTAANYGGFGFSLSGSF